MTSPLPTRADLTRTSEAAAQGLHEYKNITWMVSGTPPGLDGERDTVWAGWYAAYLLGRLGDFTSPTRLTCWLEAAPDGKPWTAAAAGWIRDNLARTSS